MSDNDPFKRAYFSLHKSITEHDRRRALARKILNGVESELKAQIPEAEQIRWEEALFITVAGHRVYFRFTYTVKHGFIEYGRWSTTRRGHPVFTRLDDWSLEPEGRSPGTESDWLHALRKQSLVAITEVIEWIQSWSSDSPFRRQTAPLRSLCPENWYLPLSKTEPA